jgi:hypothetical protein
MATIVCVCLLVTIVAWCAAASRTLRLWNPRPCLAYAALGPRVSPAWEALDPVADRVKQVPLRPCAGPGRASGCIQIGYTRIRIQMSLFTTFYFEFGYEYEYYRIRMQNGYFEFGFAFEYLLDL